MKKNKDERRLHSGEETKKSVLFRKKYVTPDAGRAETSAERRSAKRASQLQKQSARREARVVKYGSDSVGAVAADFNKRFIAAVVALVMAISCIAVEFSVMTKAEEVPYDDADKPVSMNIIVNDSSLTDAEDETGTPYTVEFPTALIEDGIIANGIAYEKVDEVTDEVLVSSIQSKVDTWFYGDQSNLNEIERQHAQYEKAIVTKDDGSEVNAVKLYVDDENNIYYTMATEDIYEQLAEDEANNTSKAIVASENAGVLLEDGDVISLVFSAEPKIEQEAESKNEDSETSSGTPTDERSDASESTIAENEVIIDENAITENEWSKHHVGVKTINLNAVAKSAASLQSVSGIKVRVNSTDLTDPESVTLPSGLVADHVSAIEAQLPSDVVYQKAIMENTSTGTNIEIARIGTYDGDVYYSLTTNENTGILLGENEQIVLVYYQEYDVTTITQVSGTESSDGGTITTSDKVVWGNALTVTAEPAMYYSISSATYSVDGYTVPSANVTSFTNALISNGYAVIPAADVMGAVTITVNFVRETQYAINHQGNITNGFVCATHSLAEASMDSIDYDGGTLDLRTYDSSGNVESNNNGDARTTTGYNDNFYCTAGKNAYITLFSYASYTDGGQNRNYFLNMLRLNGVELQLPANGGTYKAGDVSTTTLVNGSEVVVKCISSNKRDTGDGNHCGDTSSSNSRWQYLIIVKNVHENLNLEGYFRFSGFQKLYLKGLRGIQNTAASHMNIKYRYWTDVNYGNCTVNTAGYNYFFSLDNTKADHRYDFYTLSHIVSNSDGETELTGLASDLLWKNRKLSATGTNYLPSSYTQYAHNIFMYKAVPGYNPYTVSLTQLKGNTSPSPFMSNSTIESGLNGSWKFNFIDEYPTLAGNSSAESKSNYFEEYILDEVHGTYDATHGSLWWAKQCTSESSNISHHHWGAFSSELAGAGWWKNVITDGEQYYTENDNHTYIDLSVHKNFETITVDTSKNSKYPFFFPAVTQNGYYFGFKIPDLGQYGDDYVKENMSLNVNAHPYKYQIRYDLNGGDVINSENGKYTDVTDSAFNEIKRHVISTEKVVDDVYDSDETKEEHATEFDDCEGNIITLPTATPSKNGYEFKGWKLVQKNASGTTVKTYDTTYWNQDQVQITDALAGDDTSNLNTTAYKGAQPTAGFASWDDYTSDTGMYFQFVAQWEASSQYNTAPFTVHYYKEDASGTITGSNGKTYTEYDTVTDHGVVGADIIYMDENAPEGNYTLNEEISKTKIEGLLAESDSAASTNNVLNYYYDLGYVDVTIKEATTGTFANTSRAFKIGLKLLNADSTEYRGTVDATINGKSKTLTFVNGELDSSSEELVALANEQSMTITVPAGATLSLAPETATYYTNSTKYQVGSDSETTGTSATIDSDGYVFTVTYAREDVTDTGFLGNTNALSAIMYVLAGVCGLIALAVFIYTKRKKSGEQI